jgi:hypothetical protein
MSISRVARAYVRHVPWMAVGVLSIIIACSLASNHVRAESAVAHCASIIGKQAMWWIFYWSKTSIRGALDEASEPLPRRTLVVFSTIALGIVDILLSLSKGASRIAGGERRSAPVQRS